MYLPQAKSITHTDGTTQDVPEGSRVDITKIEKGSIYDPDANIPLANWDEEQGKWVYPTGGSSVG